MTTTNDMYFDPSEFDFTSLSDIVEADDVTTSKPETKATRSPQEDLETMGGVVDDISDLIGTDAFKSATDDEEEEDYNSDTSDLDTEEGSVTEATNWFNEADDNTEFEFRGFKANKAKVADLLERESEIEESHKALTYNASQFKAGNEFLINSLNKLTLGAEMQIKHIDEELKNPHIDDKQYRYLMQRRAQEKAELKRVEQATEEAARIRQEQEVLQINTSIKQADSAMSKLVPNYYQTKAELIKWMDKNGINDEGILKLWNPPMIKTLLKAMKHDINLDRVSKAAMQAKATQPKPARSTKSATTATPQGLESAKRSKAISSMGTSRQANVAAFDFLKD